MHDVRFLAVRVSHICGGIQEKSGSNLDNEAHCKITRQRNFSLSQTQGYCGVEEGNY